MRAEDDIPEFLYIGGGSFTPPLYHVTTVRKFNEHYKQLHGAQHFPLKIIAPDIAHIRFGSLQCSGYEQDRIRLCDPTDELLAELSEGTVTPMKELVDKGTRIYLPHFRYTPSKESLLLLSFNLDGPEIRRGEKRRNRLLDDIEFLRPGWDPTYLSFHDTQGN